MQLSDSQIGSGRNQRAEHSEGYGEVDGSSAIRKGRKKARKNRSKKPTNRDQHTPAEVSEIVSASSEEGRVETATPSPTLSSTPRRKRGLLESLRSDLSPKYIGFNTPPSSKMNAQSRSLRRRTNPNSDESVNGFNASSYEVATATASLSPLRNPFVSPIDKLLLKNGSTIVKSDVDASPTCLSEEKQLEQTVNGECQQKVSNVSVVESIDVEVMIPYNVVSETQENANKAILATPVVDEAMETVSLTSSTLVFDECKKDDQSEVPQEGLEQLKFKLTEEVRPKETVEVEIIENTPSDELNADPELPIALHVADSEAVVADAVTVDTLTANSPSTVSVDSAKGSSIANDPDWISFSTGDLFWGQIYNFSYWPCMVCPDPDGKTVSMENIGRNKEQQLMVHVRFCADNGRRNWVKRENLILYSGLESYRDRVQEVKEKFGKNSAKYRMLMPKKSRLHVWHEAVSEANMLADTLHPERLEKFYTIYENARAVQKLERKRRQSMVAHQEITSDVGSLYDSTDSLAGKQLQVPIKRERSISPLSPAYSPLKAGAIKRVKPNTEVNELATNGTESQPNEDEHASASIDPNVNTLAPSVELVSSKGDDFKKFYLAMKDFVMGQHSDEKLERSFALAVRNLWALREISHNQRQQQLLNSYNEQDLGSSVVESNHGRGSVKRLSNRLRNLMVRRSLPVSVPTPQTELSDVKPASAQKEKGARADDKPKRPLNRPIEEVIDDIFSLDSKHLFKDMGRGPVCKYCCQSGGKLERCGRGCQAWLHADCITASGNELKRKKSRRSSASMSTVPDAQKAMPVAANTNNSSLELAEITNHITAESVEPTEATVVCRECALGQEQTVCSVCGRNETTLEELVTCHMPQCFKAFHPDCCKYWPQAKITKSKSHIEVFRCPSHVCHTCVSDDPKGKFQHLSSAKLTKCVKCPATYHTDSTCIPAGSEILTAAHIICPRHNNVKADASVNVSWCFICVGGGQVVCCETCPTAVHAACLNISVDTNEGYICEECESGRLPLYGEMVWAKFNTFRWWPAIILPPSEVPQNIMRKTHNASDFVVRFFGTHDHGWISRRRVYLYLEGDSSEPPKPKSYLDQSYTRGVEEAKRIYEIIKLKKQTQRLSNEGKEKLHPQPYVRIKANRPVPPVKLHIDLEKVNRCECNPDAESPCGPEANCLNRVLYHECNPKVCPAGERCENQMFESRISPRLEVVYMKERGFGLVCREPLAEGTFVIEYVGEIINDEEFKQRLAQKSIDRDENFYFLSVEKDYIIDAGPKGNLARFMNHSCEPNCETQKWTVNGLNRIGLFAIKDIPADMELTFNYHWDELLGSEKKSCLCGAGKCAGQIGGKYKDEKAKEHAEVQSKIKAKLSANARKAKPLKRLQKSKDDMKSKVVAQTSAAASPRARKKNKEVEQPEVANTELNEQSNAVDETAHIS